MSESKPIDPNYEARIRSGFEKQGVMKTSGASLVKIAPGEVVIEFPCDPSLTQQHGDIHAGVLTTVVDSAWIARGQVMSDRSMSWALVAHKREP